MLAVHLAAINAIDDRFYSEAIRKSWAFGLSADGYGKSMAEGERFEVAVEADGRVVAFCGVKNGEVFGLYVHPEAQGRGVGTTLLERGEACLVAEGRRLLPLRASLNAQNFYEAHGYRLVEYVDVKSRGGLMQTVAQMEKPVGGEG